MNQQNNSPVVWINPNDTARGPEYARSGLPIVVTPRTQAIADRSKRGDIEQQDYYAMLDHARELERELLHQADESIALLRAWVAGCGDEKFSTAQECRELLEASGAFLRKLRKTSHTQIVPAVRHK